MAVIAVVAAVAVLLGVAPVAQAQIPDDDIVMVDRLLRGAIERPTQAQRLVRMWDFEDRSQHREPIPPDWFRDQHVAERASYGKPAGPSRERPGFPPWNEAVYSDRMAASGQWSMQLPTRGGSTAFTLSRSALAVFDGSDYLVTVLVRTEELRHARARLVVRMIDADRGVLPGAQMHSEPVLSNDAWTRLTVYVDATPGATWMQIELQLLQRAEWEGAGLDARTRELLPQDFRGAAYFDDLAVYQLPRVELAVAGEWPLSRTASPPELTIALRDHAGEPLHAELDVIGLDGRVIDRTRVDTALDLTAVPWRPALPAFGWYLARAHVHNSAGLVGYAETAFVWAPPARELPTQARWAYGVQIGQPTRAVLDSTMAMLRATGAGAALLSPWPMQDVPVEDGPALVESPSFRGAIEALDAMGVELSMVLERIPIGIAAQVGIDQTDVFGLLAERPATSWMPALMPLLSTYGERVRRWQVGVAGDGAALEHGDLADGVSGIYDALQRLIPRPVVVLPVAAEDDPAAAIAQQTKLSGKTAATVALPCNVPEGSIGACVSQWAGWTRPEVLIEPLPADTFGVEASVCSLVRRAVLALEAGAERVVVDRPWHVQPRRRGDLVLPRPELYAWRRMIDELAGRTPGVRLPAREGVVAALFQGQGDGTLVVWNSSAHPSHATIEGYLGEGPISVVDLWGNTLEAYERGQSVSVRASGMPVFVRGVDPRIVKLRAGVDFSPRRLPARGALIGCQLTIVNPFAEQISGRVRLADPQGWEMRPQIIEFAIEAGGTLERQVELRFGAGELSGQREMVFELDVIADQRYPVLSVPIPVEVGLPNLQVLPMYRLVRAPDGRVDAIVEVMVTNTGELAVSSSLMVMLPGFASERAPLSNLQPGQVVTRRFVFRGVGESLAGRSGLIQLREIDGNDRLNIELPFH